MMKCCGKRNESLRSVELSFKRSELVYDISNYAFVEGDLIGEDGEHAHHQVTDIAEAGNVDRVTRVLNLAYWECVELLYPYTKEAVPEDQEELDNVLREPEVYVVRLRIPETFALNSVKFLKEMIHEYMVCRVLQDWLSITYPQSASRWEEKLEGLKRKMRLILLARMRTVRRKLQPF